MPAYPRVIALHRPQPVPVVTFISRLNGVTAIGRRWDPGATHHCRLCPECTAEHDLNGCLITTEDEVSGDDAPLYSFASWGSPPSETGDGRRNTRSVPLRLRGAAGAAGG